MDVRHFLWPALFLSTLLLLPTAQGRGPRAQVSGGGDHDTDITFAKGAAEEGSASEGEAPVTSDDESEAGAEQELEVELPVLDLVETGRRLVERFQDSGVLSLEDFRHVLADLGAGLDSHQGAALALQCQTMRQEGVVEVDGREMNCSQVLAECPDLEVIYDGYSTEDGLPFTHLSAALQEAALSLTNQRCWESHHVVHKGHKPTLGQAWGYGIGFVLLVAIISNVGALLTPIMASAFFQRLLQFLVAMGAGTLAATGLLVLLPEAFDIVSIEEIGDDYIWKGFTALLSIYVFFISERFLKFALQAKEPRPMRHNDSIHIAQPGALEEKAALRPGAAENGLQALESSHSHAHSHLGPPSGPEAGPKRSGGGPVSTVAWMVMIGDVIHNFVDGMAIGAAFTENTFLGVSIGIAVICEELPHELSDVAILLHSGLTMKRALLLNFLSACVAFVGLVVGIVLGESTTATRWVLAVAGGLFLYVPLCDMLPEMSQHLDLLVMKARASEGKMATREVWIVLFCQSLGLLIGIMIIFIVVTFSGDIEVGS